MNKTKTPFTEAAAELAAQLGNRYWTDITNEEAAEYVTPDVIVAWIAHEALDRDDEIIVGDTMAQRLDSSTARTLLCAAAIGHADKVLEIVKGALIEQIARDLVYEANKITERYDPTDEEMSRSHVPQFFDDPVRRDQSALADCINSALRAARVSR